MKGGGRAGRGWRKASGPSPNWSEERTEVAPVGIVSRFRLNLLQYFLSDFCASVSAQAPFCPSGVSLGTAVLPANRIACKQRTSSTLHCFAV